MKRTVAVVLTAILGLVMTAGAVTPARAAPVTVSAFTAGTKFVGQGTNVWGTAAGAANRPVRVQVSVGGKWVTIRTGTTGPTGSYSLPLSYGVTTPGTYRFRVVVAPAAGSAVTSATVSLTRVPITVSAATAGSKFVGQGTNVWGTAGAGAAGRAVSVQVRYGTSWATISKGTTSSSGWYSVPLSYGVTSPGTYHFRVAVSTVVGMRYSAQVSLVRIPITVTARTVGTKTVGHSTNVWGTAGAGAANRRAVVQVRYGSGWATVFTGRTSSTGSYAMPLAYGVETLGKYTFRVGVFTVVGWRYSPSVTLTRTEIRLSATQASRLFPVGTMVDARRVIGRELNSMTISRLITELPETLDSFCNAPYAGTIHSDDTNVHMWNGQTAGRFGRFATSTQARETIARVRAICHKDLAPGYAGVIGDVLYQGVWAFVNADFLFMQYGNVVGVVMYTSADGTPTEPGPYTNVPRVLQQFKAEVIRVSKT